MLRTFAVILLLPGCARLAVSLNRAEGKGFNEAPKMTALARAQAQLIRRVLRSETHYDVLDLPANATIDEIKAARDDLGKKKPRLVEQQRHRIFGVFLWFCCSS